MAAFSSTSFSRASALMGLAAPKGFDCKDDTVLSKLNLMKLWSFEAWQSCHTLQHPSMRLASLGANQNTGLHEKAKGAMVFILWSCSANNCRLHLRDVLLGALCRTSEEGGGSAFRSWAVLAYPCVACFTSSKEHEAEARGGNEPSWFRNQQCRGWWAPLRLRVWRTWGPAPASCAPAGGPEGPGSRQGGWGGASEGQGGGVGPTPLGPGRACGPTSRWSLPR